MGAVPKRRISSQRRGKRRSADFVPMPTLIACKQCGELIAPHRVCPSCGSYKGTIVVTKSEKKSAQK